MSYLVDKSLAWNGIFQYSSESGTNYLVKISESAPNSNFWTMDFKKLSGEPSSTEVFRIMNTLFEVAMEYVDEKKIDSALLLITGSSKEEMEQKTKIFVRWLKDNWDLQILEKPEFTIKGYKRSYVLPNNGIFIKRKTVINNTPTSPVPKFTIKFCYNCGTENDGFQFCPNCGTNLKQN